MTDDRILCLTVLHTILSVNRDKEYCRSYLYQRDGETERKGQMVKLTKVSMAIALGLMISMLLFTSGAFAQSVNQSSAAVTGKRTNPALAKWRGSHNRFDNWRNPWGNSGCENAFCGDNNGFVRCASVMKSIKVWRMRRVMETVRVLRVHRIEITVHRGWSMFHEVRLVKIWQISHIAKMIRSLQVSQRAVRVCSAG